MSPQVVHHYLHSAKKGFQTRLRKRVRNGRATFTFTVRKPEFQGQVVEVKQPISLRDYNNLLSHRSVQCWGRSGQCDDLYLSTSDLGSNCS